MRQSEQNVKSLLVTYSIFAIAMAYLESAIVAYLRALYYPDGFEFPLHIIVDQYGFIEIGREAATLIMLWFAARMASSYFKERFTLFVFLFGVWDLFYYFWLKVFLNWPTSWLEWDILFLIPAPWTSPWLAPALVSVGFVVTAFIVITRLNEFPEYIFSRTEWLLEVAAALIILGSFFWEVFDVMAGEVPEYYPWWLFFIGYALAISVFIRRLRLNKQTKSV
ncbi:MAG: hypothetical protein GF313_00040 [Caldithrix sp.]|nr:hypothetical protein [Caldithrix sp.]